MNSDSAWINQCYFNLISSFETPTITRLFAHLQETPAISRPIVPINMFIFFLQFSSHCILPFFVCFFFSFFFFSFSRINLQCQSPMEYSISKSVMSWALAVVYICCVALLSNNNNGVQASHQVFKEQQFISPLATKKELRTGYHFQPSKHWINGINRSFFMPYTSTLLFMTWSVSFFACARGGW